MNEQERALWELHAYLAAQGLPHIVIGGLAVQRWGEPRLTRDVDVTVILPPDDPLPALRRLAARFTPRLPDAVEFARRNRMLLLSASNGVPLDIALGLPGYEEEAVRRATAWELEPGKTVPLCSAEDLIIHKVVAGRPRDLEDVVGVLHRQGEALDLALIRRWLGEFAALMGDSALPERFEALLREARAV